MLGMSAACCRGPTACCQQAAGERHAGEPGAGLGECGQASERVSAASCIQVGVHDQRCQAACS